MRAVAKSWFRAWWALVPHPKDITILFTFVYCMAFLTGIMAVIWPPLSLVSFADWVAVVLIASFLAIGGVMSVLASWWEYWKLERIGLWFLISAESMYLMLVTWVQIASSSGSRVLQLGTISFALACFVSRYFMVRTFTYRPGSKS